MGLQWRKTAGRKCAGDTNAAWLSNILAAHKCLNCIMGLVRPETTNLAGNRGNQHAKKPGAKYKHEE
jgi:hypothetical protein